MFQFNKSYVFLTLLLFLTEVFIALYVHDNIIRPYIGDVLVVVLLYCFVKSFLKLSLTTIAISVLLFSYLIETLQYLDFINRLGLGTCTIAKVVIGTSFSWIDILAYTLGIILVVALEKLRQHKKHV